MQELRINLLRTSSCMKITWRTNSTIIGELEKNKIYELTKIQMKNQGNRKHSRINFADFAKLKF